MARTQNGSRGVCSGPLPTQPPEPHQFPPQGIVGDRFFPATLITDDPAVADELTLPQVDGLKTADDPYR